jgi:hypothetical protein
VALLKPPSTSPSEAGPYVGNTKMATSLARDTLKAFGSDLFDRFPSNPLRFDRIQGRRNSDLASGVFDLFTASFSSVRGMDCATSGGRTT